MAGIKGQGRTQKLILAALEINPVLSLSSLNPEGSRSRQKALRRSVRRLLAAGLLVRMKIVVPSSPIPIVYDCVAKAGAVVLGIPTKVRTDIVKPVQETQEPEAEKEKLSLDERIQRLQKRINS